VSIARLALVLIAAALLSCGCRTHHGASGLLVFDGFSSGSYLHSIHSDGSGLRGVDLPRTCSPKDFTRDGRVLRCDQLTDPWGTYTVERRGATWARVPLPDEWRFPGWVTRGMSYEGGFVFDAPERAPDGDRLALVRAPPYGARWFSAPGKLVVSDLDGSRRRVVAKDGEVPTWSPDGRRLAFARCRVSQGAETAKCSLWTVSAEDGRPPRMLVGKTDSAPVWSADGRFVAFFRQTGRCAVVCKQRIFLVPAKGVEGHPVGPELIKPTQLFWLPEAAAAIRSPAASPAEDALGVQRCADIWNRARMQWPTGVANVRVVHRRCQITVEEGVSVFSCWQPAPSSFQCAEHGANPHEVDPAYRVWNGAVPRNGRLRLLRPPRGGHRLPLPKPPPYPMLNGYVLPFGPDGRPRPGLSFTGTVHGTCGKGGEGYVRHPDSVRCGWPHGSMEYGNNSCFKPPGKVAAGDVVFCPESAGSTAFIRVKLTAALR
jgi:WD40-like Beta Propeller Repeat